MPKTGIELLYLVWHKPQWSEDLADVNPIANTRRADQRQTAIGTLQQSLPLDSKIRT